jgi:hypothetical protein
MLIPKIKIEYNEIEVVDSPRNNRIKEEINFQIQRAENLAEEIEWLRQKLERK